MSFGFESASAASIAIDSDSGWPVLSTGEFRQMRRIPEFYDEATLADSLNRSVAEVQQQLISVDMTDMDVDFFTNASMSDSLIPEFTDKQTSIYRGAVYARSHADLVGYFSTVDQKQTDKNDEQPKQLLAQSNRFVRLLLGLGRTGVHSL
ncbi:head completion/stabilization protein [Shewanella surugensis]|uniref:Head completion/stabilization protein n=1 Tax=Shewanella surugensis TaxID=212020 RepID=A0ABT0L768_9GAMM|nr:head completion/stabilization protein [Shewanella surugensis]MCL1123533.1 head completion/stabilization protein [Shewanella surugensis]